MFSILPNWHPIFVHFTVALFLTSIGLFAAARFAPTAAWRNNALIVARWNLWLGCAISLFTIAAGWYAYNTVTHDEPSHRAMTEHRNWALVTVALILTAAVFTWWKHRDHSEVSIGLLATLVLAAGMVVATAWHGGELVYRFGLGVMSLPKAESSGHEHGQAHDHGGQAMPNDAMKQGAGDHHDAEGDHGAMHEH